MTITIKRPRGRTLAFTALACYQSLSAAHAGSVYIGYGQSEQVTSLENRDLNFDAGGLSLLASFDVSDALSVSFDVSQLDDDINITEQVVGELDIDTWGVGLNYMVEDWLFSASYASWEDELLVDARLRTPRRLDQSTDSSSIGLTSSYNWYGDSWQSSLGAGFHYADWTSTDRIMAPESQLNSAEDEGSSTFISFTASAAKYIFFENDAYIAYGIVISWNEILDNASDAVSRNGRNISQINNRLAQDLIGQNAVIGTESYGQGTMYVSYGLNENWVVDVDVTSDIGTDQNNLAWSVNLGYQF